MITRMVKYRQRHRQRHRHNQISHLINALSTKSLVIVSVHVLFSVFIVLMDDLDNRAKIALFAFLSAMILWITTKIPAGFVAIGLLVFIVLMKAEEAELLYHSLSEEVVWLMIGSFVIGEAVKQSGLAERFSRFILSRSTNKNSVLFGIASGLLVSAFFIPSTSGRAALSMPIIKQLNKTFSANEQSVLAIIAPVVILMSTSATLIGAGSHLIGIGLLESTAGQSISYFQWLIWGVPFTLVVTLLACIIIKWMLWPKDVSKGIENVRANETVVSNQPMNGKEVKTVALISIMIIGWVTESIHGYDLAFITILGALLFMLPNYGVITWKQGVKSVSWNLILFVAAATALGKVLVDTGVVSWMEKEMFSVLHLFVNAPEWLLVLIILIVAVTSHLYITSHTTRAVVFIPSLLLFSETIGINPSTVVFLSLIGMNYCITVPVSSKALLLFYEEGEISYDAKHLVKISVILMPLYILTMIIFYYSYWQWTGMSL
ncbi:citrate:succinate antiporter [Bacillus aerolatus]|uniref:Citrate:succinate antiporter n=1 Tax=Bacillus aerolatus TaxID=2653354 RepID=A0A6I1FRE1_9BACI|nr:SLC13 family permease [Bacillus aerolatus]KAB7704446.1 citrate:succinate antiporter [Bacillus aerolatus]